MSDLKAAFEKAQEDVKGLTTRPSNQDLLSLYANFKQASAGDASGKRPGFTDIAGRAKFDAWTALSGTSADDAMQAYIDKVNSLVG